MTQTLRLSLDGRAALLHDAQSGALLGRIEAGHQAMTELHFQRQPLDAGALERAIEWTEDRIQQARLQIAPGTRLCTGEADVRLLARAAGVQGEAPALHVGAVEQLFSRLVLQAFGQSPHQQDLPGSSRVFATVVLLREMLHHLRFEQIQIEAPPA
jgi:hypothetical protein